MHLSPSVLRSSQDGHGHGAAALGRHSGDHRHTEGRDGEVEGKEGGPSTNAHFIQAENLLIT